MSSLGSIGDTPGPSSQQRLASAIPQARPNALGQAASAHVDVLENPPTGTAPIPSTAPNNRSWLTKLADKLHPYVVPRRKEARDAHLISGIAWFAGCCYLASPIGFVGLIFGWIIFPVTLDRLKSR